MTSSVVKQNACADADIMVQMSYYKSLSMNSVTQRPSTPRQQIVFTQYTICEYLSILYFKYMIESVCS